MPEFFLPIARFVAAVQYRRQPDHKFATEIDPFTVHFDHPAVHLDQSMHECEA